MSYRPCAQAFEIPTSCQIKVVARFRPLAQRVGGGASVDPTDGLKPADVSFPTPVSVMFGKNPFTFDHVLYVRGGGMARLSCGVGCNWTHPLAAVLLASVLCVCAGALMSTKRQCTSWWAKRYVDVCWCCHGSATVGPAGGMLRALTVCNFVDDHAATCRPLTTY